MRKVKTTLQTLALRRNGITLHFLRKHSPHRKKPLGIHLIEKKDILSENAAKSGAKQILSNLTELIRNSLKMRAHVFTQEELDLKSQITDYPIIKRFEEIAGIEFDWNRFHNRREFRAYIKSLLNMKNQ